MKRPIEFASEIARVEQSLVDLLSPEAPEKRKALAAECSAELHELPRVGAPGGGGAALSEREEAQNLVKTTLAAIGMLARVTGEVLYGERLRARERDRQYRDVLSRLNALIEASAAPDAQAVVVRGGLR